MHDLPHTNEYPADQYPYRIRNWRRWQSYRKDRGQPPWIKVHRRLMRDPNWVSLDDCQRGQLVAIWMLGADRAGHLPSSAMIRKLCFMSSEPDLKLFITIGFLELEPVDAMLASIRHQLVTPEYRVENRERETEDAKHSQNGKGTSEKDVKHSKQGSRLSQDWKPQANALAFAVDRFGEDGAKEEFSDFQDYWLAKPGKDACKLDWDRTWMKWCRNSRRTKGKYSPKDWRSAIV